jgi:hypothetical protein
MASVANKTGAATASEWVTKSRRELDWVFISGSFPKQGNLSKRENPLLPMLGFNAARI